MNINVSSLLSRAIDLFIAMVGFAVGNASSFFGQSPAEYAQHLFNGLIAIAAKEDAETPPSGRASDGPGGVSRIAAARLAQAGLRELAVWLQRDGQAQRAATVLLILRDVVDPVVNDMIGRTDVSR